MLWPSAREEKTMKPRTCLASGFVLLALAFSGCGGDDAADEAPSADPGTAEKSEYEEGYKTGYAWCGNLTPQQVAREFDVSSEDPRAAAEAFAASFEAEQRQGAYEGCYDELLGKPSRVP
jgi:hypothetical protein